MTNPAWEEAKARDWRLRAVERSRGRETPFGVLLLTLFKSKRGRPAYAPEGMIQPNGQVTTIMIGRDALMHRGYPVGHINEIKDYLAGLAVECELTEEEIVSLFAMFRSWITLDLTPGGTDLNYEAILRKAGKE